LGAGADRRTVCDDGTLEGDDGVALFDSMLHFGSEDETTILRLVSSGLRLGSDLLPGRAIDVPIVASPRPGS
jgi:hypothetical protein